MPYSLNLYHDQLTGEGATRDPLPAAHRLFYVRFGEVTINGTTYAPDDAFYCGNEVEMSGIADWSQVWRWEIDLPNQPPKMMDGMGLLTHLRMSRVITSLEMPEGSDWLFRLDRILPPPGRIADRHQHPGPGIRCLLEGTFNVQQNAESMRQRVPGDPWWETGEDTVVAWGSLTMHAKFLRGMVLPTEWEGKVTGTWLSGDHTAPRGNWHLYVDRIVTV